MEGSGRKSLRRPKLSTRKFSAWKKNGVLKFLGIEVRDSTTFQKNWNFCVRL
jgi:hypothetical protein